MATLSANEVYLLQLINRARLDPAGEANRNAIDLNQGLPAGMISATAKQPLAPNQFLATAAQTHSQWMLDTDIFSHTGANGSDPGARMRAAGYAFTGAWTWGENIAWRGTTGALNVQSSVTSIHESLFRSAGHRANLMNDAFQEVGVGVRTGTFSVYNAAMVTEDFARSGSGQFLTGVTYIDANGDRFYTPGEGRAGIQVDARLVANSVLVATSSQPAGDYATKLGSGDYAVTFSGAGLVAPMVAYVTVSLRNIELDVIGADALASSTHIRLGDNVRELSLLGSADLAGTGNALANTIVGGSGNNALDGGAGADSLIGGGGNDTFVLTAGQANGDTIVDFTGNGTAAGDLLRFEGYGATPTLASLGNDQWRVSGNGFADTITVRGALTAADYSFVGDTTPPPPPPPPSVTTINGTSGNNVLTGTSGNDIINGLAGRDQLNGGDGNDSLFGGSGIDMLIGGNGNDLLIGSSSNDVLNGGAGIDTFARTSSNDGRDTIQDFTRGPGGDVIDISDVLSGFGPASNPFDFVRLTATATQTTLAIDANGAVGGQSFSSAFVLSGISTTDVNPLIQDGNLVMA